jgi:citrate synthase
MVRDFLTAEEAAQILGVSVQTLYVYVGRKGIRSRSIPGSRKKHYWREDVERVRLREREPAGPPGAATTESAITLITDGGLYYRGDSAVELAETASFESVAARLWAVEEAEAFGGPVAKAPPLVRKLQRLLRDETLATKASAVLPLLEDANPRAYDLSHSGMARTGADVVRWLAALAVGAEQPSTQPLHSFIAEQLGRSPSEAELIRRLLILGADQGLEPSTWAVRILSGKGVTLWRSVPAALSASAGRHNKLADQDVVRRFLAELFDEADPKETLLSRVRAGETPPGFGSPKHSAGDPRAACLLSFCAEIYKDDPAWRRLRDAISFARDSLGLAPNFALAAIFVGLKLGVGPKSALYQVGRSAGWVAHGIEQADMGALGRQRAIYTGGLPEPQ